MKKVIGLVFIGLLLLSPSEGISGQGSKLLATDHGHPIMVGMHISEIGWIFGRKADHPCAVDAGRCLIVIGMTAAGGKASIELEIDKAGIVRDIIVN